MSSFDLGLSLRKTKNCYGSYYFEQKYALIYLPKLYERYGEDWEQELYWAIAHELVHHLRIRHRTIEKGRNWLI